MIRYLLSVVCVLPGVVSLAAERVSVSLTPGGVDGLYVAGETPSLTLKVFGAKGVSGRAEFALETLDYFGKILMTTQLVLRVSSGAVAEHRLDYPGLTRPGFYCTRAKWNLNGETGVAEGTFVRVGPKPAKADRLFGISFFSDHSPERYARLGVGTKGVGFRWRELEDKNGKLSLEPILAEIKALRDAGMDVVGSLPAVTSYAPRRYLRKNCPKNEDPLLDPEAYYAAYAQYVREVVLASKDMISHWGLGGEINLLAKQAEFQRPRYIDLVKATSKAIRAADPAAKILGLCVSGADGRDKPRFQFVRGMLPEVKDYIDGLGLDQYTAGQKYGDGYANLNSEQAELRDIMLTALDIVKKNGLTELAIDEKGPSIVRTEPFSSWRGTLMANMTAREFIIVKTIPEVRYWLYFRPFNWSKTYVVDWGMWEKGCPRQVVSAYAATARQMNHAMFLKGKFLHDLIGCWLFTREGHPFATLWYNGPTPLAYRFKDVRGLSLRDVQGNPMSFDGTTLTLGSAPVYLYADDLQTLEGALEGADGDFPVMDAVVDACGLGGSKLAIRNLTARPLKVRVVSSTFEPARELPEPLRGTLELAPQETKAFELGFAAENASFELESENGRRLSVSGEYHPYHVKVVTGWDDVSRLQPICLDDPERQLPNYGDMRANRLYTGPEDLSAQARIGHDWKNLYVEVEVRDDVHCNLQAPGRAFTGDSVQIFLDTTRDAKFQRLDGVTGLLKDDYNFVAALANGQQVLYCHVAARKNSERMADRRLADPEIVRDEQAKLTRYRIRIPFEDLNPLRPRRTRIFGASLVVFDKDDPNAGTYGFFATPDAPSPVGPSQFMHFIFD